MLISLTEYLTQFYSGFNVFSYLTTRAILSALTALVLSFAVGPYLIQRLTMQRIGQQVRQVGPGDVTCRRPARRRWAAR